MRSTVKVILPTEVMMAVKAALKQELPFAVVRGKYVGQSSVQTLPLELAANHLEKHPQDRG